MAVDAFGNKIDEKTGAVKQTAVNQLPMQQPNNTQQPMQLTKEAMTPQQGADAVTSKAQQMALQQPTQPSQLQQATQQSALNFVQNPMGDYDPQRYKQGLLDKAAFDWGKSYEAARQQFGNTSGSGLTQENLLQNMLQKNVEMANLGSGIDTENYNRYLDAMAQSISTGLGAEQQAQDIYSQQLGNLANVANIGQAERLQAQAQDYNLETMSEENKNILGQMAAQQGYTLEQMTQEQINDLAKMAVSQGYNLETIEEQQQNALELQQKGYDYETQLAAQQQGYDLAKLDKTFGQDMAKMVAQSNLDESSKQALMELQAKLDSGLLTQKQDFEGIQNGLDRQAAIALQAGDIQGQKDILALKDYFDTIATEKAQEYQTAERIATQSWQTGERVGSQDFEKGMQYLDQQHELAIQNNDIDAQKWVEKQKQFLSLTMQQQEMNQEEKMANIESQLRIAENNNDLEGRANLLEYQHQLDIDTMTKEAGFDIAKINVQGQIEQALANEDFQQAMVLQDTLLRAQARENAQDRGIEQMKLQLQERGIDITEREALWNKMKDAGVSEDDLFEFINNDAQKYGIEVEPIDEYAIYTEIQNQMNGLRGQFINTHPEYRDPETGWLNAEGEAAFNKFYNDNMYGTGEESSGGTSLGGLGIGYNNLGLGIGL